MKKEVRHASKHKGKPDEEVIEHLAGWLRSVRKQGYSLQKGVDQLLEQGFDPHIVRRSARRSRHRSERVLPVLLLIVLVILGFLAAWMTFVYQAECDTFACYQVAMQKCAEKVSYINEEPEATWQYSILGRSGNMCRIEVRLLQARKGELGLGMLTGQDMTCSYGHGVAAYPEKDIAMCRGELRESLQNLVIQKLHTHILENLGQIDEGLNG
jgi:hypothetical protein